MSLTHCFSDIQTDRQTYTSGSGNHSIRHKVEVQTESIIDVLEELDDLEGQHILTHIIPNLEYAPLPQGTVGRELRQNISHCLKGQRDKQTDRQRN